MRHVDMRKLPAAAQEERRRQVVGLRRRGLTYRGIAEQVGLSRTGVIDIWQRFAAEGAKGLVSKPPGRKPDGQRLLEAAPEAAGRGGATPQAARPHARRTAHAGCGPGGRGAEADPPSHAGRAGPAVRALEPGG